jgi:hypothetical protein
MVGAGPVVQVVGTKTPFTTAEFTSESWAASKSARKRGALILCLRGCEREIPLRDLFN